MVRSKSPLLGSSIYDRKRDLSFSKPMPNRSKDEDFVRRRGGRKQGCRFDILNNLGDSAENLFGSDSDLFPANNSAPIIEKHNSSSMMANAPCSNPSTEFSPNSFS